MFQLILNRNLFHMDNRYIFYLLPLCVFTILHSVLKNDKIINIGSTTHALVGKDLRPMNMKKNYPEIYEKLECHTGDRSQSANLA